MSKWIFFKYIVGILILICTFTLFSAGPRQPMYLNFQKMALYNNRPKNEYFLAVVATDDSIRSCMLDTFNVHIILETLDGKRVTVDNEDIIVICLGNMYNKEIAGEATFLKFNILIDNINFMDVEGVIDFKHALKKFIELLPLVFEAQVIKFSDRIQEKTEFTKDKQVLINAINQVKPHNGKVLFDAIHLGIKELKYQGDEVTVRFSIIITSHKYNYSKYIGSYKNKIYYECRENNIPLLIFGVGENVDSKILSEIARFGGYQHVRSFPDLVESFDAIGNLVKDTYVFRIPAVENFSNLKTIYIVKKTPAGNIETLQDIIVQ